MGFVGIGKLAEAQVIQHIIRQLISLRVRSNWRKLRKPKNSSMTVYWWLASMKLIFRTATGGLR